MTVAVAQEAALEAAQEAAQEAALVMVHLAQVEITHTQQVSMQN